MTSDSKNETEEVNNPKYPSASLALPKSVILVQRPEISTPETSPPHSPILLKRKKVLA
jgi:hypothetical protein